MTIEIWSDVMCPFCYIGKRRLEAALKEFELAKDVKITWKSFMLNPEIKTDPGKNSLQYLVETKGWSEEQARQAAEQVVEMAALEGLEYDMEATKVANTLDAHRLIQLAKRENRGDEMEERLFRAYFTEGKNIADHDELIALAREAGIDGEKAKACLDEEAFADAIQRDIEGSRQIGVRGVPFFVFDRKYAVSGAQPKDVFLQTLRKCVEPQSV